MKTKDENGITLIALMITIILMLILASITISSGISEIRNSRDKKELAELRIVNHAVYEMYVKYTKNPSTVTLIGEKITTEQMQAVADEMGITLISIPDSYNENIRAYYRLTPDNLEKIGIYDSEDTYIVNYVTGEVINETRKQTRNGELLYTYTRAVFDNQDVTAF